MRFNARRAGEALSLRLPTIRPWSSMSIPTLTVAGVRQFRILTARAATSANVSNEIPDSAIISSLARSDNGMVSVGEKAVAFVKDRYM